jgi:hypothetical protein
MAVAGLILSIVALALSAYALVGERLQRPKLEIRRATWEGEGEVPWSFLVVRVFNRPLGPPRSLIFSRRTAADCQTSLTFTRAGELEPSIDQIPGRWSAVEEPLMTVPGGAVPDPQALPRTYRLSIGTSGAGEEVAVARTRDGEAFAFSSESYLYAGWRKPEWELAPGAWSLTVRAAASDATSEETFSFRVADDGGLAWS